MNFFEEIKSKVGMLMAWVERISMDNVIVAKERERGIEREREEFRRKIKLNFRLNMTTITKN